MGLCQSQPKTLKLPKMKAYKHITINLDKIKEYEKQYKKD